MRQITAVLFLMAFASAAFAADYPKPYADRPIVKEGGHGEAGLNFAMSGKDFKFGDLGIFGLYAPIDNLEFGLTLPLALMSPDGLDRDLLSAIGPIWVAYQFMDFLAAELDFTIPIKDFDAKMITFHALLLAKYKVHDMIALVGALGFGSNFGFDKGDKYIPFLVGAQASFTPEFFAQLRTGISYNLEGMDASSIPLQVRAGYTVAEMLDLGIDFWITDLNPPEGAKIGDMMSFGIFANYLF